MQESATAEERIVAVRRLRRGSESSHALRDLRSKSFSRPPGAARTNATACESGKRLGVTKMSSNEFMVERGWRHNHGVCNRGTTTNSEVSRSTLRSRRGKQRDRQPEASR